MAGIIENIQTQDTDSVHGEPTVHHGSDKFQSGYVPV